MKRALVLVAILTLAAFSASAAGLSGEFSSSITVNPGYFSCYFDPCGTPGNGFLSLGGTLKVDYVLDDWTFGAVSTFDNAGFASQKFTVAGVLGAFTLSSSMTFDPMAVTEWTYELQTDSECPLCPTATAWGPRFLKWDVTAGVSIAGITVEAYVLQDYSNYDVAHVGFAIDPTGVKDPVTKYVCTSYNNGMGWRLKVAGSFGSVKVTSLTYFNLTEADARETYCPAIGKRGVFYIGANGCDFVFNEEYLMLEGFTFGCAEVDIALKILCSGFDSVEFLISDISIGGLMTMDFKLGFDLDTKYYNFCVSLDALAVDCFIVELGFGNTGYVTDGVIDNITIHGFGFTYSWNGITFTSYTEFDAYSVLFSPYLSYAGLHDWNYLYGCKDPLEIWLPFVGGDCGTIVCDDTNPPDCTDTEYVCVDWEDGYEYLACYDTERFKLWEMFKIDVDADACCGGLFDLTFTTYFGDHQVLEYVYSNIWDTSVGAFKGEVQEYLDSAGTAPTLTWTGPSTTPTDGCDVLYTKTGWMAGTTATLFNWASTEVDLGVGIGSNITLTAGFDISAFGWSSIDFGFKWTF